MRTLKVEFSRRKWQMMGYLICVTIGFLIGFVIDMLIFNTDDTVKYGVPIGCVISMLMFVIARLIAGSIYLTMDYDIAVSMSVTRKRFLHNYLSFALLEMIASYIMFCLLYQLEKGVIKTIFGFAMAPEVLGIAKVAPMWLTVGFIGILAIEMLGSALYKKFGQKIFWVFWILCMSPYFLEEIGVDFEPIYSGMDNIGTSVAISGVASVCGIILIIEAIIFTIGYKVLKRQQIA